MKVIYKISSLINPERIYIGSAVNYLARMSLHLSHLKNNKHGNIKLQRHFNKYGLCDFVFSVVEEVNDKNNLLIREQFFMDTLSPYFNIAPTAGSQLGMKYGKMKEAHKEKIRKANTGVKKPSVSIKLSVPIFKYDLNGNLVKEYRGLSEAMRVEGLKIKICKNRNLTVGGFVWVSSKTKLPDFTLIRNRIALHRTEKNIGVLQIDKAGNVVNEFNGIRVAGRITGIDHRSIQSVAAKSNPKRHTAGGYYWNYKQVA